MAKQRSFGDLREILNSKRFGSNNNQSKISIPKLCKVCLRASFLKCMECDVIYCSSVCQIKDWESHQYTHQDNYRKSKLPLQPQNNRNVPKTSVHNRLKEAASKGSERREVEDQMKKNEEQQLKSQSNLSNGSSSQGVDLITKQLQKTTLSEHQHAMAEKESVIEVQNVKRLLLARKFTRHIQFKKEHKDSNGFAWARVTGSEQRSDGLFNYFVSPLECEQDFKSYMQDLQEIYDDSNVPVIKSLDEMEEFLKALVMAKIDGKWYRVRIINNPKVAGMIAFEAIDTGKQVIGTLPTLVLKGALEAECMKSAFCFKVYLDISPDSPISIGTLVNLRIEQESAFGESFAEMKDQKVEATEDELNGNPEEMMVEEEQILEDVPEAVPNKKQQELIIIDHLQVKQLHVGKNIILMYLDGSSLGSGLLHVCEYNKENVVFYERMAQSIADYVILNPNARNYKPVIRELILAKFTDGLFYRAVCLNSSEFDVKCFFVDFGSINVTDISDVMQMPPQFLSTSCSHMVSVSLVSGKNISTIDVEETKEHLLQTNIFSADIEKKPGNDHKYRIILDDSLVVFKK